MLMFDHGCLDIDPQRCYLDTDNNGDFQLVSPMNESELSVFDLMTIQDHTTLIPGYTGKITSFDSSALLPTAQVLGAIDEQNIKYCSNPYCSGQRKAGG